MEEVWGRLALRNLVSTVRRGWRRTRVCVLLCGAKESITVSPLPSPGGGREQSHRSESRAASASQHGIADKNDAAANQRSADHQLCSESHVASRRPPTD